MAVDIKPGTSFEASVPKMLFETRVLSLTDFGNHNATTAEGQRLPINSTIETNASPINVVVIWTANLKHYDDLPYVRTVDDLLNDANQSPSY